MKIYNYLSSIWKKGFLKQSKNYYRSVYDCPLYSFIKAKEHKNPAFLLKDNLYIPEKDVETDLSDEGIDAYSELIDEVFSLFGIAKGLKKETEIKLKLVRAQLEYASSGERFVINQIKAYQKELDKINENTEGVEYDFNEEFGLVSKGFGGGVFDIKKTTVHQYLTAKNTINNG